ncbi:MAG: hypothetical protein CMG14_06300 [Candidatus Marinimicrobia bacterium]|nr:hypothetical protein [Candidatus Neomarinimicrobiota bacterium]|tara:strand:+ start:600 stop:806 length:207 start_codon:yes stop_codon:yes gene_type:complete
MEKLLEITDITWDESENEKKDLPKELKLKWNSDKWNRVKVSNWLSKYFNVSVNSLNIKELKNQDSGSG